MFSLINENHSASLFNKIGLDQNVLNGLSDENNLFQRDKILPFFTESIYRASQSLSDIGFDYDSAAVTASALTGSLTASDLTFIQFVGQEVQEHLFYRGFFGAFGVVIGHLGLEAGSFEETQKLVSFHDGLADSKLQSVRNLLSQSRGDEPESIPGFFHVVGSDNLIYDRRRRCYKRSC